VLRELEAELGREKEEVAVPPLLPTGGWCVAHSPGTSFFEMHRRIERGCFAARPQQACHVRLRAALRSVDPSFWNSDVAICEWVPFRVVMTPDVGQVAPEGLSRSRRALVADLAAVQSQLKVRRIWFAPLDVDIVNGGAVPAASPADATDPFAGSARRLLHAPEWPPAMTSAPDAAGTTGSSQTAPSQSFLNSQRGPGNGEAASYGGPCFADLSRELQQALLEWLSAGGVDARLGEYVCQQAYWIEQQEYNLWLARLAEATRAATTGAAASSP
jgi:hypothetical protein